MAQGSNDLSTLPLSKDLSGKEGSNEGATMESGKNVIFLNNFSASTNWFWSFETLLEQSLNCLLFPE